MLVKRKLYSVMDEEGNLGYYLYDESNGEERMFARGVNMRNLGKGFKKINKAAKRADDIKAGIKEITAPGESIKERMRFADMNKKYGLGGPAPVHKVKGGDAYLRYHRYNNPLNSSIFPEKIAGDVNHNRDILRFRYGS